MNRADTQVESCKTLHLFLILAHNSSSGRLDTNMGQGRLLIVALVAALGGFVYGFDTGIIATTLGHDSFKLYFYGPSMMNPSYTGAIVSLYNAGQAIGGLACGRMADQISRKYTISITSLLSKSALPKSAVPLLILELTTTGFIAVVGAAIQTGSVHVAMMVVGRFVGGMACGSLLSIVPTYISETAPVEKRGFFVGITGMMIAVGFAIANWVGYAGSFAPGDTAWRIPLALQIPFPILLTIGTYLVPFSPRWCEYPINVLLGLTVPSDLEMLTVPQW